MSTVATQDDIVTWGNLQLDGPVPLDTGYQIEAMADGTHFGNPISLVEQLQSMAIDGALAARTGWDARTIPVRLRIGADDGDALAQAEAALTALALMDQPPAITWTPPLALSEPAVFDVMVADLQRDTSAGWDSSEKLNGYRYFILTLTCLPFARSTDTLVVPALAPPPTPGGSPTYSMIDDGTSTTNWTKQVARTSGATGPEVISGGVHAGASLVTGTDYIRLIRTASVAMPSGKPYLVIDVDAHETQRTYILDVGWGSWVPAVIPGSWNLDIDGVPVAATLVSSSAGENGSTRLFFDLTGVASFSTLNIRKNYDDTFDASKTQATRQYWGHLTVYQVQAADSISAPGSTTRQQSRLTTIYGSMPTRAALRLYDATPAALGTDLLVYTSSNINWAPPLRRWLTASSTVTADSAMVSGARHPLGATASKFLIPARLLEAGAYALSARISCSSSAALTWQARMVSAAGADTLGSDQIQSGSVTIPVTTGYQLLDLADGVMLPVFEVETDDYAVELTLTGTSNMTLDEAWLFGMDNGALTVLHDSGDSSIGLQWIEVRSPDLGAARPSVFGGVGALGALSACMDAKATAFGPHRFDPGPLLVFTMTTSSLVAQCEVEYYPRFHSHPEVIEA